MGKAKAGQFISTLSRWEDSPETYLSSKEQKILNARQPKALRVAIRQWQR